MKNWFIFLLLFSFFNCEKKQLLNTKNVAIQPYENFSKNEAQAMADALDSFYKVKCKVLSQKKHDEKSFINIKSPRYRADSIIRFQGKEIPNGYDFILGLTHKDISITKVDENGNIVKPQWKYNDFGVMGLAYRPGKSAVISDFRLKHKNSKIHFTRLKKVVIHEFGHNLGLPHCPNKKCVMTSANEKISTIDQEKMDLCKKCKQRIGLL